MNIDKVSSLKVTTKLLDAPHVRFCIFASKSNEKILLIFSFFISKGLAS